MSLGQHRIASSSLALFFSFFFFFSCKIFIILQKIADNGKCFHLQIGLAVGDIETIQKTAFLRNKGRQINFIADIERKFPKFFTRRMHLPTEIVRARRRNQKTFWK